MSTTTLAPAPAVIGPASGELVCTEVTVPAVEEAPLARIMQCAQAWASAGSAISSLAGEARGLGINAEGVWQGKAADAADHRMDSAINHADSTGWAASLCGKVSSLYAGFLKTAMITLRGVRLTNFAFTITDDGIVEAKWEAFAPAAIALTGIVQSVLALVQAAQAAAGTAIEGLSSAAQEIPTVGWGGANPLSTEVMPAQTITLPYGSADIVGDPKTADRVITLIGGVGSRGEAAMEKQKRMAQQLADENTAVISWNGYHAPSNILTGTNGEFAKSGGERLRAFQDSLREINPEATLHVSGYSYGSVVVGQSAADGHLDADRVSLIGSPGLPVNNAAELNINPGAKVEAYATHGDLIETLSTGASVGKTLISPGQLTPSQLGIHGADPTAPGFGAENMLGSTGSRSLLGYAFGRVDDLRLLMGGEANSHSAYYEDPAVLEALKRP